MTMPFIGPGGRRGVHEEIRRSIAESLRALPVYGFHEMISFGDARVGSERHSGFMEMGRDFREWLLPLSAREGLVWKSEPVPRHDFPAVVFVLAVGFGNGSPLPQPSGQWDLFVNEKPAVSFRMVNHSQLWKSAECAFAFSANRIETAEPFSGLTLSSLIRDESFAAFGPALLSVPMEWLTPEASAVIRIVPREPVRSTRWFQLTPCVGMLRSTDVGPAAEMLAGKSLPRIGEYRAFFGDIHTHSGEVAAGIELPGCGIGTRRSNYEYARGPGALDFYALTDHEYQIGPEGIEEYLCLADDYEEEGSFVCLPAFEHTDALHGHRNAYFRASGGTVVSSNREWGPPTFEPEKCLTPAELWTELERTGVPFLTAPHHPSATSHPLNLDFHDPRYDRLYEVYSCWGSSEYYGDFPRGVSDRYPRGDFRDAVGRGLRFGAIASADGHDGHPGDAQSPLVKHHHLFHFCGSGRAAVLASSLTRAEVFDALYARRCYGTTGPPILLSVTVDGAPMGAELPPRADGNPPLLRVACVGTNGIDQVRIVRNGRLAHTFFLHGERRCEVEWSDGAFDARHPAGYYVRVVQRDRESAWSSPIWIG